MKRAVASFTMVLALLGIVRTAAAVVIEGALNASPERGIRLDLNGPALPLLGSRQTLEAPYPPVPVEVRNRQTFSIRADAPGLPPLPELPGAPSGLLTAVLGPVQSLPGGLPSLPVSVPALPIVNEKGIDVSLAEILPGLAAGELPALPDLGLPEIPTGGAGTLPQIALPALPSLPGGSLPELGPFPAPPSLPSLALPAPSLGVAGL